MTTADLVTGQLGKSIDFDGTDDYLTDADFIDQSFSSGSISVWFNANPSQNSNARMVEMGDNDDRVGSFINAGEIYGFGRGSGFNISSDSTHNGNTWTYSTITWQSNLAETFINSDKQTDNDTTVSITLNTGDQLNIGQFVAGGSYHFSGRLDEARVSNIVRADDWISAEFTNQNGAENFYNIDNGIEDLWYGEGWLSSEWQKRILITVNASQVNGTHTDFPVFVDMSDLPDAFFDDVNSDGSDIRVTAADGQTQLALEVVSISATDNRGEMHFKAPSVTDLYDTDFYIYYDNPNGRMLNAAHELGSHYVWSNGYVAVYHMQENPGESGALIVDSTSNRNHGTPNGSMTSGDLVNGQVGMALDFDGGDDYIDMGDVADMGTNDWTISAWFKTTDTDASLIAKSRYGGYSDRWWATISSGDIRAAIDHTGSAPVVAATSETSYTDGNYHHYTGVYNRNANMNLYLDATNQASSSMSTSNGYDMSSNYHLYIAHYNDGTGTAAYGSGLQYDGELDEIRISNIARSSDWIYTEYNNQNGASSFYTVNGTVETVSDLAIPKVLELKPKPKTVGAPRRHPLTMLFNKIVNVLDGNINIFQDNGSIFEAIDISSGQVTGGGTTELIITPTTFFTQAETYYVLIDDTAIEDASNNIYPGIDNPETWKFTIQGTVRDDNPIFIFDGMI